MKKNIFTLLSLLLISAIGFTQKKLTLDPTFGSQGVSYVSDEDYDYTNYNVFVSPVNQNILTFGYYSDGAQAGIYFAKYNADGILDNTFGQQGLLKISLDTFAFDNAIRIRQAPDNGFLILMTDSDPYLSDTTGILCITAQGEIATGFGNNGVLSATEGLIMDFDVLSDGKVLGLVNIFDDNSGELRNSFIKYTSIGGTDLSYGTNGEALIYAGINQLVKMDKAGQQYMCVGYELDPNTISPLPIMLKVNPNGSLDQTFGTGGLAYGLEAPDAWEVYPLKSLTLKDGSILMEGFLYNGDTEEYGSFVSKFNANGTPSSSFGINGYLVLEEQFVPELYNQSLQLLSTDKILLTKTLNDGNNDYISVKLYNLNGVLDDTFGDGGEQSIYIEEQESTTFSTTMNNKGNLIVVGDVTDEVGYYNAAVSRFTIDGLAVNTNENVSIKGVTLSPNPVQHYTNINFEISEAQTFSIALYDLQGKMVQQFQNTAFNTAGKQTLTLNINANLPQGEYILCLTNAQNQNTTLKLVKN